MKNKIILVIKNIKSMLDNLENKLNKKNITTDATFHSLSPISNADIPKYEQALDWALKNSKEENIKNIAITGPYGSGKSSILYTYQKRKKHSNLHFLNISLATFKEEIDDINTEDNQDNRRMKNRNSFHQTTGEELVRLIEISILQQIFYHEDEEKIPDSRFKKIKSNKSWKIALWSIGILISFLSFVYIFDSKNFFQLDDVFHSINEKKYFLPLIAKIINIVSIVVLIYKLLRLLLVFRITKLNIKNAEIEIGNKKNESILNKHLDEILYFFEVTPYNVVFIEDLDRFQQTEIFTKLREINLLINNSKKIKGKNVVFIYAVRDEMFKDIDRTKFFDFIIPVIPVINSSNSGDFLWQEIQKKQYNISKSLIEDISIFIDDMRLLYNIINEFYLYQCLLNGHLNLNNLLAIITYKNLFPNDFVDLSNNSGELYKVLESKRNLINISIQNLKDEILRKKERIAEIEAIKIYDTNELRKIYILQYLQDLVNVNSFVISGKEYDFNNIISEDLFDYFINGNVKCNFLRKNPYNSNYSMIENSDIPFKFSDVEKKVNPDWTYKDRLQLIEDYSNNKANNLKIEIEFLGNEIQIVSKSKIKDILTNHQVKIQFDNNNKKQNDLIFILLRNGYIDENYMDYISVFYDSNISREDYTFLINAKNQVSMDFDYKLKKIENLLEKLKDLDFSKYHFLNYNLLDFIIGNEKYKDKENQIFNLLVNGTTNSQNFIDSYVENGLKVDMFFNILIKHWKGFLVYLSERYDLTEEKKEKYFRFLLQYSNVEDIKNLSMINYLKDYMSYRKDFSGIIGDKEKIKLIIKELDIKFNYLDLNETTNEMLDFVYFGNYYTINKSIITLIIKAKGEFNQADFDTRNYYAIIKSGCYDLIQYVNKNIQKYANNVYLNIDTNTEEDEESLVQLLNSTELSLDAKSRIISKTNTLIKDLEKIDDIQVNKILFEEYKVEPTWYNIIYYYVNEEIISDEVIAFINNESNSKVLSKFRIDTEKPNNETVEKFLIELLLNDNISVNSYYNILQSISGNYTSLELDQLSENKVKLLIDNNKLGLSADNFNLLKENFENLIVRLLEVRKVEYLSKISDYPLDNMDILKVLKSDIFSVQEKTIIINTNETVILKDNFSLVKLFIIDKLLMLLKNDDIQISKAILLNILELDKISIENKIKIFNARQNQFSNNDIDILLSKWNNPYNIITTKGRRPALEKKEDNIKFVEILRNKGYISSYDLERSRIRVNTFRS